MENNLQLWEKVRVVPATAIKPIIGGRLKGKSDISPIWRFKTLTQQFGPCGEGWKYEIVSKELHPGANGEIAAFVDIHLYVRLEPDNPADISGIVLWSAPIPGTGGSMFVSAEKTGLYVNDECFKMATTDAISVACKSLGIAADVYWDKDVTKYDKPQATPSVVPKTENLITLLQQQRLFELAGTNTALVKDIVTGYGYQRSADIPSAKYNEICNKILAKVGDKSE